MIFLCFTTTALATLLLLLSNNNQMLLASALPRLWRHLGFTLLAGSFFLWHHQFSLVSTVFLWCTCIMVMLALLPVLTLLKNKAQP